MRHKPAEPATAARPQHIEIRYLGEVVSSISIVIPTYNERENVEELHRRLTAAVPTANLIFVDDSSDDTPRLIEALASDDPRVTLIERGRGATGGLSGAVIAGIGQTKTEFVVVMDGDLQHPPEIVPELVAAASHADIAIASRFLHPNGRAGLSGAFRHLFTWMSTTLVAMLFPRRVGRKCTDPMTGFFCVRRTAVDSTRLRPQGFKILLEILATHDLTVSEIPFEFAERHGGQSKASLTTGLLFARQLLKLRLARCPATAQRIPRQRVGPTTADLGEEPTVSGRSNATRKALFALAGLAGVAVSFGSLYLLIDVQGMNVSVAYAIQTVLAIETNFILNDRLTWSDRTHAGSFWRRFGRFHAARVGLMIPFNQVLFFFAHPVVGTILANLACLSAATVANWFLNDRWTFKNRVSPVPLEKERVYV